MSPVTRSAKRAMAADENNRHPKRLRGDMVVPDIDSLPSIGPDTMDYSCGSLSSMCSPFFPELRQDLGPFLVDKTKLIEDIVQTRMCGKVDLVLRPRRCGKSTMLQMLKSFFAIPQDEYEDPHQLFRGLYIADKRKVCQNHMGKYAVMFCDFKNITGESWEEMFASFKTLVSDLYQEWREYLWDSLTPEDQTFFVSILQGTTSVDVWRASLMNLSFFLAQKSGRKVIVLIDEYETPNNLAYELGFFDEANNFLGRGVLPPLLKTNKSLAYAVLAGVTPFAKSGWLNNINIHALHRVKSVFAGMLMFTETEILELKRLSHSELDPEALKTHYNSYLAGCISVYNPVSIMSAFEEGEIQNFWIATGDFPLLNKNIPEGVASLDIIKKLLSKDEVFFPLQDTVTFSNPTLDMNGTLTLLYYAGYLTITPTKQFKIPNREVMVDWARWITGSVEGHEGILGACTEGPVSTFVDRWPNFMQQRLDPKAVAKARCAVSSKTPEKIYHVYLLGLLYSLELKGWEIIMEARAGGGYIDIRLMSKKRQRAVLIELKSSKAPQDIEKDAKMGLQQIIDENYRNREGFPNVRFLREYGIASYHLESHVEGRYLELNAKGKWVEVDDPQDMSLGL